MNKIQNTNERGYVALISILILSSVLLVTTLSLAQFGIASRFFILDLEFKTVSEKLAEACVHVARIKAYNDPAYEVEVDDPVVVSFDGKECTIISVTPGSGSDDDETTIVTTNTSDDAVTNYIVVVDNTTGDFLSWEEIPTL